MPARTYEIARSNDSEMSASSSRPHSAGPDRLVPAAGSGGTARAARRQPSPPPRPGRSPPPPAPGQLPARIGCVLRHRERLVPPVGAGPGVAVPEFDAEERLPDELEVLRRRRPDSRDGDHLGGADRPGVFCSSSQAWRTQSLSLAGTLTVTLVSAARANPNSTVLRLVADSTRAAPSARRRPDRPRPPTAIAHTTPDRPQPARRFVNEAQDPRRPGPICRPGAALRTASARRAPCRAARRSRPPRSGSPGPSASTRACGLISWAANTPVTGASSGSRPSSSRYRVSCSTPSISPRRFTSTATARAVGVPAEQVDRADRGHVLPADQGEALAEHGRRCAASSSCRCASTPSLTQPGIHAQLVRGVLEDLLERDPQLLAGLVDHPPHARRLLQPARRAHPVERLVRPVVGVDRRPSRPP